MIGQPLAQTAAVHGADLFGLLNAVLRNQLTSTNQVFLNSFILEHWRYHLCAERMYVESVKETRRSMRSLRHLTMMGMEPDLGGTRGLYSVAWPLVGRDVGELFRIEKLHAERSLGVVRMAIAAHEAAGSLEFLGQAQKGQAEYITWLAGQIEALLSSGEARYRGGQGAALQDGDLKTFLMKVAELQANDPDFPGEPGVADAIRGETRRRIVARIDELLAVEIMSIERNFVDAFIFDYRGEGLLADIVVMDALASMRRAQRITEHLLALGEVPVPAPVGTAAPSAGKDTRDYLNAERHLEDRKAAIVHAAFADAGIALGATRELLAGLLRQYDRRAEWLASQVDGAASIEGASVPPGTFQAMLQRWGAAA